MNDWDMDARLLDAWRAGDKQASRRLVERHFDAVVRFFRNKINHGVEDLLQQTFLAFVESRDKIRTGVAIRAYLLSIAHYVLCAHFRKLGRGSEPDFSVTRVVDLEPGPSAVVARSSEQQLLLAALRRLSVDHQIALELCYWEELNAAQIAEIVGVSHSAMRSRLVKAREQLAHALRELEASPAEIEQTSTKLDDWVAQLRDQLLA